MVARSTEVIYGHVNSDDDIREINRKIRAEMETVTSQKELTELKRRSDYLCTLTRSRAWRKRFGAKVDELLQVAMEENRRTVEKANVIARQNGWENQYDAWGE
jgi:hypothetical protein